MLLVCSIVGLSRREMQIISLTPFPRVMPNILKQPVELVRLKSKTDESTESSCSRGGAVHFLPAKTKMLYTGTARDQRGNDLWQTPSARRPPGKGKIIHGNVKESKHGLLCAECTAFFYPSLNNSCRPPAAAARIPALSPFSLGR